MCRRERGLKTTGSDCRPDWTCRGRGNCGWPVCLAQLICGKDPAALSDAVKAGISSFPAAPVVAFVRRCDRYTGQERLVAAALADWQSWRMHRFRYGGATCRQNSKLRALVRGHPNAVLPRAYYDAAPNAEGKIARLNWRGPGSAMLDNAAMNGTDRTGAGISSLAISVRHWKNCRFTKLGEQ